ncbi:MAG: DNA polymerase III subunit delta [Anaerolineales bacterium]|jgi:DNA polymerase-3 subunit delta
MSTVKPVLYLLYGDDSFAMEAFVHTLYGMLGDPATASMNTQTFDARSLDMDLLTQACLQVPFLSERRLIILDHAEALPQSDEFQSALEGLLDALQESTALVCLEQLTFPRRKGSDWRRTRLRLWAEENADRGYRRLMAHPRGTEFTHWIQQRAEELGGAFEAEAGQLLADWVAEDLYLADQEIEKLLDFVDRQRPVTPADVEELTPFRGQGNIFDFVDALGQRQAKAAQLHLWRVLQDSDSRRAFAMIIRQFRLLILAREALDRGMDPAQALALPPFVVQRILKQARTFSADDLDRIYHELMRIDLEVKSSQLDLDVAMDTLIGALALP